MHIRVEGDYPQMVIEIKWKEKTTARVLENTNSGGDGDWTLRRPEEEPYSGHYLCGGSIDRAIKRALVEVAHAAGVGKL